MPLKKDPLGGGSNADGTINLTYCSLCFSSGTFCNPEIDTAQKMQAFVKEKLKEKGFPGLIANLFTMGIPKLERWKNPS